MAKLIFKAPYYKLTAAGKSRGGLAKYIATREGVELLKRGGMAGYIGERKGSNGMFSDEGTPINLSRICDEMDRYTGNIWGLIFSLAREDAERLGYNCAEQWVNLLRSHRNDIAKEMNIAPENLCWYAAYHNSETHPHVHMLVWSKNPNEAFLSPVGIHNIKHFMSHDIFRQELISIYKEQTHARDSLKKHYREQMKELISQIQTKPANLTEALYSQMCLLCEKLSNHKGKQAYGYLDKSEKNLVDGIVQQIANDPKISELYDLWYQLQCETYRTYTDVMPEKIPLWENPEFKSIRNTVVQLAANIHQLANQPIEDRDYDYARYRDLDSRTLEFKAESGDMHAMYRLGRRYLKLGDDLDEAEYWLQKAAEKGDPCAMFLLYRSYKNGTLKDGYRNKMTYLLMAVDAGFGFAEYEYAMTLPKKSADMKLGYLKRAAEHGCFQAEYTIGKLYMENGQFQQALEFLERAAQRDLWSQTHLGLLYFYQLNDHAKGMEHLTHASAQGYTPAQTAIQAIQQRHHANIVVGICNLLSDVSKIINEQTNDQPKQEFHKQPELNHIDRKLKQEIEAKQQGIVMSGI